jgi:hypothetical protein
VNLLHITVLKITALRGNLTACRLWFILWAVHIALVLESGTGQVSSMIFGIKRAILNTASS